LPKTEEAKAHKIKAKNLIAPTCGKSLASTPGAAAVSRSAVAFFSLSAILHRQAARRALDSSKLALDRCLPAMSV